MYRRKNNHFLDSHSFSRRGSFYQEGSYRSHLFNLMEKIGISKYTTLTFIVTSMIYFIFGSELAFTDINFEILAFFWDIPTHTTVHFSVALRIMLSLGALIAGFMAKHFDRVQVLIISIISYMIFSFFCSVYHFFWWFFLCRCFSNIALSIAILLSTNLLTEYLPTRTRQFYLMIIITFLAGGKCYFLLINSLFYNQAFDSGRFKTVNFLISIPTLIPFFIILFYIRDSPIYLFSKSKDFEGFIILAKMAKDKDVEFVESDKHIIKRDLINRNNYILKYNFFELAKSEYILITTICFCTHICCLFNLSSITPLLQRSLDFVDNITRNEEDDPRYKDIDSPLLICFIISLGSGILAYYLSKANMFKKRKGLLCTQFLSAIISFSLLIFQYRTVIIYMTGVLTLLNYACFQIIVIYIAEVFPTRLRDYAQSFIFFFSFLTSSFIPYFIYNIEQGSNVINRYIIFGVLSICGMFFSFFIKIETYNRPLDQDTGIIDEDD